ncbi:MAG: hypothetical protein ACXWUG_16740, partial [Polyangiales bacterium]
MLGRSHLIVPLVLALTSAACSTNHPVETPARTTEDVGSPLGAARRLAAWDGAIAASLAPKTGAWRAEGSGFATVLGGFEIGVDTTFEVRAGAHRALSLAPLGAQAASTALEDGHLVQRGAFRATDVLWTASRGRVESYFLLHDASAPTSFAWKLAFDPSWRPLLGDQALTFVDASNATRLRVSAPIAIDGD